MHQSVLRTPLAHLLEVLSDPVSGLLRNLDFSQSAKFGLRRLPVAEGRMHHVVRERFGDCEHSRRSARETDKIEISAS